MGRSPLRPYALLSYCVSCLSRSHAPTPNWTLVSRVSYSPTLPRSRRTSGGPQAGCSSIGAFLTWGVGGAASALLSHSLLSPVFQLSTIGYQLCGKFGTLLAHAFAEGQAQGCYQTLVGKSAQRPG